MGSRLVDSLFVVSIAAAAAACSAQDGTGASNGQLSYDGVPSGACACDGGTTGSTTTGTTTGTTDSTAGGDAGATSCDGGTGTDATTTPGTPGTSSDAGAGGAVVGCTLTQGYWKNHPSAWPVASLTIGGVAYTESDLIALFDTAPAGDASLILCDQLVAAMLNAATGATVPASVQQAIDDAQAWMSANADADGRLPFGVSSSSAAGSDATQLASTLDAYNNGLSGTPHCGG